MMGFKGVFVYHSLLPLTKTIKLAITLPFPFLGQIVKIDLMPFFITSLPFETKTKIFLVCLLLGIL